MITAELLDVVDRSTWRKFIHHWGAEVEPGPRPAPVLAVPASLLEFHAALGRVEMNHLAPLSTLRAEDGVVIVYSEEQGVFHWGLREDALGDEDPAVLGRYNEPGEQWTEQAPTLALFLTEILVLDAAFGGLGGTGFATPGMVPRGEAERVLAPMQRLPWPAWSWPCDEAVFYVGEGTVGFVCFERAQGEGDWCSVWVGGRAAPDLDPFRPLAMGADWIWPDEATGPAA